MSDYFPEEVIQDILLRLPIKSLINFSSVCKSWRSMIQASAFIHTHLRRALQSNDENDTHLLVLNAFSQGEDTDRELGELFSLHWDNPTFGEYTKLVNPFIDTNYFPPFFVENFHVVGTCNGLICLAANFATIIWNPCARKFMFLPRPRITFSKDYTYPIACYAFGYDSYADDYKVLRIVSDFDRQTPCEGEVWSLARGSWKSISAAVIPADFKPVGVTSRYTHAFVNGVPHWLQYRQCETDCIRWFDMISESFGTVIVPDAVRRRSCFLSRYGESLALLESQNEYPGSRNITRIHMWVMKEFGLAESWTKLLSICLEGTLIESFGLRKSCELVFRMFARVLVSVDVETKQAKDFPIDGRRFYFMDSFVESLVLLGHANAISY